MSIERNWARRQERDRVLSVRNYLLAVAAFGAGRNLGLDQYVENYDRGGQTLIGRYPRFEYVLG